MEKKWIVVDVENSIYEETLDVRESFRSESGEVGICISKRRLCGGKQDGLDVLSIDAGGLSFVVLLTRGMNILKARSGDVELKWDSPIKDLVHPKFVPLYAPNGCGWLEGFCEWIARCGLESNGAPEFDSNGQLKYPLHGRLSNLPARRVEVTFDPETGVICVTGEILEASVFGHKFLFTVKYTVQAGTSKFCVEDSVTNLLTTPDEFELLYHINTGYPLVSPGAVFIAPFHKMFPRDQNAVQELPMWDKFVEPEPGRAETCYFFDLITDEVGATKAALINSERNKGLVLSFNKRDFPYFILWKTQRPNGDIYVSGLEPAVNLPNTRSFEKKNGRVVPILPNETKVFRFEFDVLDSEESVRRCEEEILTLQGTIKPTINASPDPTMSE